MRNKSAVMALSGKLPEDLLYLLQKIQFKIEFQKTHLRLTILVK
jgi:hypothetical protein